MLSPGSRGDGGTDAAARLVEAVAPLWPGADLSVRRAGPMRGRSWLVLPSLARPILLVPPTSRGAATALQPTGTGRGEVVMRAIAALQRRGLLRLLPLSRLVLTGTPGAGGAESVLADALGEVDDLVVRLGRRRFNRALVLLPFDGAGRLVGVVKVARGESARRVLRQEHDTLVKANERDVPGLHVPAPLAFVETGELAYFAMSPLTSDEVSRPRPVPVRQMLALADLGHGPSRPLRATPAVERLRRRVAALEDPAQQAWTGTALDALLEQLGDVEVPQGAWHGDWVPWNMAREGDDVLLWDWEHFDLEALRSWDHLHYLAQDLRTRAGTTPAAEDAWLAEAQQALADDWDLDEPQRRAVLRAYLIEVNLRYLHDRQEDPQGTPSRPGWARELVERLGGAVHEPVSEPVGAPVANPGTSDARTA
jgi:hypothetical protein